MNIQEIVEKFYNKQLSKKLGYPCYAKVYRCVYIEGEYEYKPMKVSVRVPGTGCSYEDVFQNVKLLLESDKKAFRCVDWTNGIYLCMNPTE